MFKLQSLDNFSQLEEESTLQTPLARLLVKLTYCKSSCWLCAFQANSCFMAIFASVTAAVAVIDSYKRVPKVSFLGCLQLQRAVGQATGCRWGTKHPTQTGTKASHQWGLETAQYFEISLATRNGKEEQEEWEESRIQMEKGSGLVWFWKSFPPPWTATGCIYLAALFAWYSSTND